MFKYYDDLLRQMEYEMRKCSAEAMRRLIELPNGDEEFWLPQADVYETDDDVVVRVELAGVRRESLGVSLSADRRTLSVRGFRSEAHIETRRKLRYHRLEIYFGPFERDIPLPRDLKLDVARLRATYKEGFLVVTLPKSTDSGLVRSVPITDAQEDGTET